ncbi:phage minor head protein [Clostridium brassicae]|uniref:Phage minor head protein n=1 Tax=Clostridium brassicae TaxID=2999072 RepID=A0ABT4D6E1_9CLOT|nr:phage minor head protein [Clostridium brassicae]MCY6957862.1 phage minor head protein [Clostridium brassicae]
MLQQYDRIILPLEKRFKIKITTILNKQAEEISKTFKKYMNERKADGIDEEEAEEISNNIYKADKGVQTIMAALLPLYMNAGELGNNFFNNIHFANEEEGTLFAIIREDYLQWLEEYGAEQVVNINTTTKELTKRIIKNGLMNGDSIDSISEELSSRIKEYTKARAVNIAETEMHNSFMRSNFLTGEVSGFKFKKWISAQDASVRPSHQSLDGMVVKVSEDFKPGLSYPGDPRASAKETIRCRCVIRFMMQEDD